MNNTATGKIRLVVMISTLILAQAMSAQAQGNWLTIPGPRVPKSVWTVPNSTDACILRSDSTVVLGQAINVKSTSKSEGGYQQVASGRFKVLETLAGKPISGEVSFVNPPEQRSAFAYIPPPPTRVVRVGELWLLVFNQAKKELDLANCNWLTGSADPLLAAMRSHRSWMSITDPKEAYAKMKAAALDSSLSPLTREAAVNSLIEYGHTRSSDVGTPGQRAALKQSVVDLLAAPGLPTTLRPKLIKMTSVDLKSELTPDSADSLQLYWLLRIVEKSRDEALVDAAANRLYFVLVQQPAVTGDRSVYFSPEIVSALELRSEMDKEAGRQSFVDRTLNNLALIKRRNLEQIRANYHENVVIRHVPKEPNSMTLVRIAANAH